eukprot:9545516-Alexandrium_andersonii.AAC.1
MGLCMCGCAWACVCVCLRVCLSRNGIRWSASGQPAFGGIDAFLGHDPSVHEPWTVDNPPPPPPFPAWLHPFERFGRRPGRMPGHPTGASTDTAGTGGARTATATAASEACHRRPD